MRDREQEYPSHQSGSREYSNHDPSEVDAESEGDMTDWDSIHQPSSATNSQLPQGYVWKALLIGVIAGILASAQGVIIILANSQVYLNANRSINSASAPLGPALTILGLTALSVIISAIIYFIGGLITGRIVVRRRWAFFGGFAGGVVSSIIGAILKLIPSYPNAGNTGFSGGLLGVGGGLIALIIGLIILGVLAGLVSLFGAWLTTRHHPYYFGYTE